jgi:hypothetical protein
VLDPVRTLPPAGERFGTGDEVCMATTLRAGRKALSRVLGKALGGMQQFLGLSGGRARALPRHRLAPVLQLEDRRLLSVAPVGSEFRVNSYTTGPQQTFPQTPQAVAMNPVTGDYVIAWSSQNQDGSGWGVYAQRYNAAGAPQGPEFRVNTTTANDQQYASVAMDGSGNYVITWSSQNQDGSGWGVYARRYNGGGVAQGGEFLVNQTTTNDQLYSSMAMDGMGNFVVTWSSHQNGNWDVYARMFNKNGTAQGGEFPVNTTTAGDQEYSYLAMDPKTSAFVITWSGHQSGQWNVYAQMYNPSGVRQGGEFLVNTVTTSDQEYSTAALDPNSGNLVITWSGHQTGTWDVYGQRFSAAGAPLGGEFLVNTATANDQEYSDVAVDPGTGIYVITWSGHESGHWQVYAQAYSAAGAPQGGEFQVNTSTGNDREYSALAMGGNGNVVLTWSSNDQDGSNWGVYAQQYAAPRGTPGITVGPTSLTTSEAGTTASFTVALASRPTAPVTINLTTSVRGQGSLSHSGLTFSPSNWNVAQAVTVTGLDDHAVNGDQTYQITGIASSADQFFNGLVIPPVNVTNRETDVAAIVVTPVTSLTTPGVGGTATFAVALTSRPTGTVTIALRASDPRSLSVSRPSLTFTPGDWAMPRLVNVTALNGNAAVGGSTFQVSIATAVSADPQFQGLTAPNLNIHLDAASGVAGSGGRGGGGTGTGAGINLQAQVPGDLVQPPGPNNGSGPQALGSAPEASSGSAAARTGVASARADLIAVAGQAAARPERAPVTFGEATPALVVASPSGGRPPFLIALDATNRPPSDTVRLSFSVSVPPLILPDLPPAQAGPSPVLAEAAGSGHEHAARLPSNLLWNAFDRLSEELSSRDTQVEVDAMALTGLVATSGYVLLNTRAGYWLMSLLTSRPLWKQFDPLEVLADWETGDDARSASHEPEETLLSLVE